MLDDAQRGGPVRRDRLSQPMQRADTGISTPGKSQPARASHPDHLVIDQVRGHADEVEVAPLLSDDLVPGSMRDEMCESLQGNTLPVMDVAPDRIGQGQELHIPTPLRFETVPAYIAADNRRTRWPCPCYPSPSNRRRADTRAMLR